MFHLAAKIKIKKKKRIQFENGLTLKVKGPSHDDCVYCFQNSCKYFTATNSTNSSVHQRVRALPVKFKINAGLDCYTTTSRCSFCHSNNSHSLSKIAFCL